MPSEVKIRLTAEQEQLQAQLAKAKGTVRGFAADIGTHLKAAGGHFKTLAMRATMMGGAIAGAAAYAIRAANEQLAAEAKLAAVIKATGGAAGYTLSQLKAMASGLQEVTTYGDETTLAAMAMLGTFRQIKGDEFKRAVKASMDLATVFGGELNQTIVQVGKALDDPIRGLTALRKTGVSFTEEQQDQIKALVETNKIMEAQGMILGAIEGQVGGASQEVAKATGALEQMRAVLGDVGEDIGKVFLPTVNRWAKAIKIMSADLDAETVVSFVKWGAAIVGILLLGPPLIRMIRELVLAYQAVASSQAILMAFSGPKGWAMLAAGAAVAATGVYAVKKAFDSVTAGARDAWDAAGDSSTAVAAQEQFRKAIGEPVEIAVRPVVSEEDKKKFQESLQDDIGGETVPSAGGKEVITGAAGKMRYDPDRVVKLLLGEAGRVFKAGDKERARELRDMVHVIRTSAREKVPRPGVKPPGPISLGIGGVAQGSYREEDLVPRGYVPEEKFGEIASVIAEILKAPIAEATAAAGFQWPTDVAGTSAAKAKMLERERALAAVKALPKMDAYNLGGVKGGTGQFNQAAWGLGQGMGGTFSGSLGPGTRDQPEPEAEREAPRVAIESAAQMFSRIQTAAASRSPEDRTAKATEKIETNSGLMVKEQQQTNTHLKNQQGGLSMSTPIGGP